MTNASLIAAQRILDLFEEGGLDQEEQEAALEVALVIVRKDAPSLLGSLSDALDEA